MKANDEDRGDRRWSGLRGDRYATKAGHYSEREGEGREVTLVARGDRRGERRRDHAREDETRRNVVTEGVALDELIGREFRIGKVVLRGVRTCPPCAYLEGLLDRPGMKDAMAGRGGVRADIGARRRSSESETQIAAVEG